MNRWLKGLKDSLIGLDLDRHDLFVFGGTAAVTFGVWEIHQPTAYIVAGIISLWLGLRGVTKS